jgi:hypothetical protein
LPDLVLPLLFGLALCFGTLSFLILPFDVATLFLRLLFALPLLFPTLLPLLIVLLALPALLFATLLWLWLLRALALSRLTRLCPLSFFATPLSLSLPLFLLTLVCLASLLTPTTSPLCIGAVGGPQ